MPRRNRVWRRTGNRGPNDFRARNGKRRREPPIIDASAAEVPIEPAEPTVADPAAAPVGATTDAADATPLTGAAPPALEAEPIETPETAEPVLFGSARRDPAVRSEWVDPATVTAGHDADSTAAVPVAGEEVPAGEEPRISSTAEPDLDGDRAPAGKLPRDSPAPFSSGTGGGAVPPAYAPPPPARAASNVASWVLGLCSLALLAALVWVLLTEPQRDGRDEIADLRGKVAALEARPDPAKGQSDVQAGVADLEKRLADADADRAAMGKTVSDLSTRLDAVAQQAQTAQQSAEAESAKPASPEPAPAEPAPSGGGSRRDRRRLSDPRREARRARRGVSPTSRPRRDRPPRPSPRPRSRSRRISGRSRPRSRPWTAGSPASTEGSRPSTAR